ncbi:MAG: PAS domain S-box protein [Balneolaceae bacterium]|nr:MAG: PAS domain S-box protein [Balneolaceae bacterium]
MAETVNSDKNFFSSLEKLEREILERHTLGEAIRPLLRRYINGIESLHADCDCTVFDNINGRFYPFAWGRTTDEELEQFRAIQFHTDPFDSFRRPGRDKPDSAESDRQLELDFDLFENHLSGTQYRSSISTPIFSSKGKLTGFITGFIKSETDRCDRFLKISIERAARLIQIIMENRRVLSAIVDSKRKLEEYRYAVDQSSMVVITDENGITIDVNENTCRMSGYTREELIGSHTRLNKSGYHPQEYYEELWKTISSGRIWRGEIKNRSREGRFYWVDTTIIPILGRDGTPVRYMAMRSDITEKKQLQHLFSEVSMLTNTGVWEYDLKSHHKRTLFLSPVAYTLFSLTEIQKPTIDSIAKLIEASGRNSFKNALHLCIQDGTPFDIEFQVTIPGRELRWLRCLGQPEIADGEIVRIYGSFQDIDRRKRDEILLREQAQNLIAKNRELEEFAFVASHDLQEPLRMIISFLNQLEKRYAGLLDERGITYLNYATDGAERMRKMILDLLDYSRIGSAADFSEMTDLNQIVRDVQFLLKTTIDESSAIITTEALPALFAPKIQLHQLFFNLISNALKYRKPGIPPRIHIACVEDTGCWGFSVQDNGVGIHPDYHNRVFDLFQRLHAKSYSGTGIGLAICKKIVTVLGGEIWVDSQEDEGTIFYFTLSKQNSLRSEEPDSSGAGDGFHNIT